MKCIFYPIQNLKNIGKDTLIILKKSITVEEIRKNGYHIPYQYQPRLNYLKAVDKLILDESEDRV
ncbi:Holliday junction resolvase RecU [Staphylococcus epidermidis]